MNKIIGLTGRNQTIYHHRKFNYVICSAGYSLLAAVFIFGVCTINHMVDRTIRCTNGGSVIGTDDGSTVC